MSPAAVSERGELGVRGGYIHPSWGSGSFVCVLRVEGVMVRTRGQRRWGRIWECVTGAWKWTEDPGAGREEGTRKEPPSLAAASPGSLQERGGRSGGSGSRVYSRFKKSCWDL